MFWTAQKKVLLLLPFLLLLINCKSSFFYDVLSPEERHWLIKRNNTIFLAPAPDYPPIDFFNEEDQYAGISADYIRLLEKKIGVHFQIVRYSSWPDILKALKEGSLDMVSSAVPSPSREEFLLFSKPYFTYPAIILTPQTIKGTLREEDLLDKKIGVIEGYTLNEYLEKKYPQLDYLLIKNNLEGIRMVSSREIDALITDLKVASYYIEKEQIQNLRVAGETDFIFSIAFASRVGEPMLNSILEKGLSLITEKEKENLEHRWIELSSASNFLSEITSALVFIGFGITAALFLFFLIRPDIMIKEKASSSTRTEKSNFKIKLLNFLKYYWPVYTILLLAIALTTGIYISTQLEEDKLTIIEKQWLETNRDKILLAPNPFWPPFEFFNSEERYSGLISDYIDLIQERLGIDLMIQRDLSWNEVLEKAKNREIDILGAAQKTSELEDSFFFSEPFFEISNVIIVRKSLTGELSLADLSKRRVAVGAGYAVEKIIKERYPNIILVQVPDLLSGLRMVSFDEVEAMIIDIASALYFIEREGITNLRIAGNTDITYEFRIAVTKEKPILRSAIEKTLRSITEQERNAIKKRWIRAEQTAPLFNKSLIYLLITVFIIILLVFVIILLWNRTLRIQINQHTKALKQELELRRIAEQKLQNLNLELENRVQDRTLALKAALEKQKEIQSQLVQTEKLAALGELVAGIAHEINTPVGVAITASSNMITRTEKISLLYENQELTQEALENFLEASKRSSSMILKNLQRAGELIQSFKQVSVDQTSGEKRVFNVLEYLKEIFLSLNPKLRKTEYKVNIDCPENLNIDNYPGAFSQIITNFVINSLVHGFDGRESGKISVQISESEDFIFLKYSDDGIGISHENLTKIFDPFFTTQRGHGGSGLGLHIVFNLVTQILQGSISCESEEGKGVLFTIIFPRVLRD